MILICFFVNLDGLHSLTGMYGSIGDFINESHNDKAAGSGNASKTLFFLEDTIIWTIVAYIFGHIIAYLSSVTVEKFALWTYDYPSRFLLSEVPAWHYWNVTGNPRLCEPHNWSQYVELIWRILIGIFLLPISLCSILLGKLLCLKSFFVKQLDNTLKQAINSNIEKLANSLRIDWQEGDDFHRVIYHYEYERQTTHAPKMDNYVALYGFLRAMTFIFNCATLWILCKYALPTIAFGPGFEIDWHFILVLLLSIAITYIFFMVFMKFYRRFTLEVLMCLVIDTSFKETRTIPYNYTLLQEIQTPTDLAEQERDTMDSAQ